MPEIFSTIDSDPPIIPTIIAPWSLDSVLKLNQAQKARGIHPFTCGGSHDHEAVLLATVDGWMCSESGCEYQKFWAYDPDFLLRIADATDLFWKKLKGEI